MKNTMFKFVSRIVQPNEVESTMNEVIDEMFELTEEGLRYQLVNWRICPYWVTDQKHDLILVVMQFLGQ